MSEGCFWMIYFVLLHPKLKKEDAEILSTPQVIYLDIILLKVHLTVILLEQGIREGCKFSVVLDWL